MSFLKQVWSESIDHDLKVQGLVVQVFIELSITLMSFLLLPVYVLHFFKLVLLLDSILLQDRDFLTHLFLDKHVILHATLKHFGCFAPILANPSRIALFIKIGEGDLINVEQDVVDWFVRVVNGPRLIVEVQRAYRSPVDALLLVKLETEIAVAQDVILVVNYFYLAFFEVVSRFSHYSFLSNNSNLNC